MHLLLISVLKPGVNLPHITSIWCKRAAADHCVSKHADILVKRDKLTQGSLVDITPKILFIKSVKLLNFIFFCETCVLCLVPGLPCLLFFLSVIHISAWLSVEI